MRWILPQFYSMAVAGARALIVVSGLIATQGGVDCRNPGPVQCVVNEVEQRRRVMACLQRRPLSAMHVHRASFGRPEIGGKCGIICALRAPSKVNFARRQRLIKNRRDSVQGVVRIKAKQQEWQQDLQREPEPSRTPPLDRERMPKFEWKEFEEAVEFKDLRRALKALESLNNFESDVTPAGDDAQNVDELYVDGERNGSLRAQSSNGTGTSYSAFSLPRTEYMKILDTCQGAMDLELVGQAYGWLQDWGFLQSFGKYKARVFESGGGRRVVTAEDMLASSGLAASSLSPKKWGLSGNSSLQLVAGIALFSILVNNNIDVRPLAVVIVILGLLDSIYLGGAGQAQVLSFWPGYRRRMLVHEAGHVLVAYLLGCPVRGVVLDAAEALKSGISGQAGTQFWDESLAREVEENKLTEASVDRYCIVLFAGIAAEGLVYGEAEGGESDENLYKAIISGLQPPWGPSKMSNHARWSVLQAFNMLKEHKKVHGAIVQELEKGSSLASLINTLETTMAA